MFTLPVAEAHAVGNELAVMVEVLHAPVAQSTVLGPQRPYATASVAQPGQYVFFGTHVTRIKR